ncbi:MAG: hypothetical protein C5B57_05875 [Blastocatellia bacterium]|nr:MAG: hypothetical protein C5B57_05875 [Blastocatellia bacterium]
MATLKRILLVFTFVSATAAQSSEPPLSDSRLTVHTLLREDIFAGFMANDMQRFARAEHNIDVLLEQRPAERANLLAWKAGTQFYRAVLAHEAHQPAEFKRLYQHVLELFEEAGKLPSGNDGVAAITGGSHVGFADRLPEEYRAAAWSRALASYQLLWKAQSGILDKLPLHFKGELLAGLTQSAERTGHTDEAVQYLDKMLEVLQGTPYEPMAKRWKENPAVAANTSLACKSCHEPGRLSARLEALNH